MADNRSFRQVSTGIETLDQIFGGGLPERSVCVVAGQPGCGKTVLVHQIFFHHLRQGARALYVTTMAEPSVKMVRYMQTFDFVDAERLGKDLHYLDIGDAINQSGPEAAGDAITAKIKELRPTFVCVDSFKALDRYLGGAKRAGEFAHRLAIELAAWDANGFFVGEYDEDELDMPIFTIADSVLFLKNAYQTMYRQRFLEVHKLRGSGYLGGMHPYNITGDGLEVFTRIKTPVVADEFPTSQSRVPSGIAEFDAMLSGGLQSATATMLAGGSGTGKTLTGLHFIMAAAERGERGVIVSFQENPAQLEKIAASLGWDLAGLKSSGLVTHLYQTPVEIQADTYFHRVMDAIGDNTSVVLFDSMKDIESVAKDISRYKDFLYSMVSELKARGVTVLMTNEIPELFGPFQFSESGVSFITDTIILLRYVEMSGRMSRAMNIMKMRGSEHSKDIREFRIADGGIEVLDPITAYSGVMTGLPTQGDQATLRHLPAEARFLLETLRRIGPSGEDRVVHATGLSADVVHGELSEMQQQGPVIVLERDGQRLFRATV